MNKIWKWILIGIGSIGGGGVVITVALFALNAYIQGQVKTEIAEEIKNFPTIEAVDNKLALLTDGIEDNKVVLTELKTGQDEFRTLFINYLQDEASR